jgi:hypothetical protein
MPVVVLDTEIVSGTAVHTDPRTKQKLVATGGVSKAKQQRHSLVAVKTEDNRPVLIRLFEKKPAPVVHHPTIGYATCKGQETRANSSSSTAAQRSLKKPASRSGLIKRLLQGPPKRAAAPKAAAAAAARTPSVRQPSPAKAAAAAVNTREASWPAVDRNAYDRQQIAYALRLFSETGRLH